MQNSLFNFCGIFPTHPALAAVRISPAPVTVSNSTRSAENSKRKPPRLNRDGYKISIIYFSSPNPAARTRERRSNTPAHKPHLHRLLSRFPLVLSPCGNCLYLVPHGLYSGFYGLASAFIIFIASTPARPALNQPDSGQL